MEIEEKVLDIPSLEIKRLLALRGFSQKDFAERMGINYTLVSKFLGQGTYISPTDGQKYPYKLPHVRRAFAEFLKIPFDDLWGTNGAEVLKSLIEQEIYQSKIQEMNKSRFAPGAGRHPDRWSFKRFIKNLMALGKPGFYRHKNKK